MGRSSAAPLQRGEGGDDVGGDRFATADGVYTFVGFGFEMDFSGRDTEGFGEGFAHFGEVGTELWFFGDDNGIDVLDGEVFFVEKLAGVLEEEEAVGTLPFAIAIGKVGADIAKTSGAKERVAKGMREHIAIGMANGPFVKGEFDAADDKLRPPARRWRS